MSICRCPLEGSTERVLRLGNEMNRALRRLRRDLRACRRCPLGPNCERREAFQLQIETVLMEMALDWGPETGQGVDLEG